jgi:hypothetical protein
LRWVVERIADPEKDLLKIISTTGKEEGQMVSGWIAD